jgi:hypothetical protein
VSGRNEQSFEERAEKPNSVHSCVRPRRFSDVIWIGFFSSAWVKLRKVLRETEDARSAGLDWIGREDLGGKQICLNVHQCKFSRDGLSAADQRSRNFERLERRRTGIIVVYRVISFEQRLPIQRMC